MELLLLFKFASFFEKPALGISDFAEIRRNLARTSLTARTYPLDVKSPVCEGSRLKIQYNFAKADPRVTETSLQQMLPFVPRHIQWTWPIRSHLLTPSTYLPLSVRLIPLSLGFGVDNWINSKIFLRAEGGRLESHSIVTSRSLLDG